jgi:glycerol-3-phosphate dehydrogenase
MSNDPRPALLDRLRAADVFDLVVIGGGATGLGVAVDAAARGLSVALFEAEDFAKGTSSRATKLLHGGVRYLAQGNIALVREALHERGTVLRNAPHLARPLAFVMPLYGGRGAWFDRWFYGAGLRIYDWLAAAAGLADTEHLGRARTEAAVPGVRRARLRGGIRYWDGQFDDARLALALARTAEDQGALVLNRCRVTGLLRDGDGGRVGGVRVLDVERGE